jgi:2-polyprenyl-3-methyl-5-hydroxy-6-metoxy-1,4-benzoquinol methylase
MMVERNVAQFDADVRANAGYLYTTNAKKSSVLANQRLTDVTRMMVDLRGKRVIDVGCGDGTYTDELFTSCAPAEMLGVDASAEAVEAANRRFGRPGLRFDACSVYDLPYEPGSFDVAVVRGLLHHLDDAPRALARIGTLARQVFLIEPNGYNPTLKLIERFSRYHREHGEKSYAPSLLRRWIRELGGTIEREHYAGLVPFFCPDWMATGLKAIEPAIEAMPAARQLSCAVFTVCYRTR